MEQTGAGQSTKAEFLPERLSTTGAAMELYNEPYKNIVGTDTDRMFTEKSQQVKVSLTLSLTLESFTTSVVPRASQ